MLLSKYKTAGRLIRKLSTIQDAQTIQDVDLKISKSLENPTDEMECMENVNMKSEKKSDCFL